MCPLLRKGGKDLEEKIKSPVGFLLILPALSVLGLLYVYPLTRAIWSSFYDKAGSFTLANYAKIFELYTRDIIYSVLMTVATVGVVLVISIVISSYLRFKEWKFLDYMYRLPLFIPFLIVGHAMRIFLAPHGTLNSLLTRILGVEELPGISGSWAGLLFAFVWVMTPFATLIILGAFKALDPAYVEAAQNLGASKIRIVFDILIPLSKPSIMVAMILTFVRTISSLTIPLMVGPNKPNMITVDMMFRVNYFNDWGAANSLGVVSYLIVMALAIYYLRYMVTERGGIKG
ncbi:Binding-protein-dependent transport systems inner membrane component precursor [Thermotoga neapolitana DSM 4359]|uniref:Binding-protein-dependent transport systems inner membrane component n=1 Tax=Thermotoga neapolitana (strain ATCC 49049 / DSM 4359 / NBRC 107923 / NS-E) TaxID=309803 RepID=B9KBM4_THENN|nr:Binding-protein-dependent transport systems inner membrane component precursor [Thermotoga neapolitana DSM 4359]